MHYPPKYHDTDVFLVPFALNGIFLEFRNHYKNGLLIPRNLGCVVKSHNFLFNFFWTNTSFTKITHCGRRYQRYERHIL